MCGFTTEKYLRRPNPTLSGFLLALHFHTNGGARVKGGVNLVWKRSCGDWYQLTNL